MPEPGKSACVAGIIPARWGSTRFPGKPLHLLAGRPLLQHVWERVRGCRLLDRVLVATDDPRIREAAESFGATVAMTSAEHPSGTDRIAEAVGADPGVTHVVNIQGDEPLIDPGLVDSLVTALLDDPDLAMVTAACLLGDRSEFDDPDVVKVVRDRDGNALYFSRSGIPYRRSTPPGLEALRHVGIYGYRRDFLERFVAWPPGVLEQTEHLEQLRALENGARIRVIITSHQSIGLDTPEQVPKVEALLAPHPLPS